MSGKHTQPSDANRRTASKQSQVSQERKPVRAAPPRRRTPFLVKVLTFLGITILSLALVALGIVWVMDRGPSPALTSIFCQSVRETSAIRWLSNIFLTEEELARYITVSTEDMETESVNTSLIHLAETKTVSEDEPAEEPLQLLDISLKTCKGKLLIVKDPKRIILGTSENFGQEPGLLLTDMVAKYNGIAGTNAGGFNDLNGTGDGGRPQGLVIVNSEIIWGMPAARYNIVGIDENGILQIGTMTGEDALAKGLKWGVSFVTHDGQASALIINGEVQSQNLGTGVNPRTAIGQRDDGSILLLVLDGRSVNTLGATMEDIVNIMLEYGAVNAGNLDGGSSSVMVYDGEIINNCASVTGPRRIPTGFIVLKEGERNE